MEETDLLLFKAKQAMKSSYSPYSNFAVGAAVLMDDNKIFLGSNIENASYGLSICAERVAIFNAISDGSQKIKAIAVIGDTDEPISPCGACRQVIVEFAENNDIPIILANLKNDIRKFTIDELLPYSFKLNK